MNKKKNDIQYNDVTPAVLLTSTISINKNQVRVLLQVSSIVHLTSTIALFVASCDNTQSKCQFI